MTSLGDSQNHIVTARFVSDSSSVNILGVLSLGHYEACASAVVAHLDMLLYDPFRIVSLGQSDLERGWLSYNELHPGYRFAISHC